jgi:small subunit ribosomal protein S20
MANTASAEKRHRQSQVRNDRNRARKSALRTAVKKVRAAVQAGNDEAARKLLPETLSLLDRTASRGVIHPNQAARSKSRLTKAVEGLAARQS